jgi:hypothetical protein
MEDDPRFGFGSSFPLSATSILRQLSGVEQTKPDESGPLAADLPLSGGLCQTKILALFLTTQ